MIFSEKMGEKFIKSLVSEFIDINLYDATPPQKEDFINFCKASLENQISKSWSGGGTSGSCWSEELVEIEEEDEPFFQQLHDLINDLVPEFTEEMFYDINRLCSESEYYDSDYYGGRTVNYEKHIKTQLVIETLNEWYYKQDLQMDFDYFIRRYAEVIPYGDLKNTSVDKISLLLKLNDNINNENSNNNVVSKNKI